MTLMEMAFFLGKIVYHGLIQGDIMRMVNQNIYYSGMVMVTVKNPKFLLCPHMIYLLTSFLYHLNCHMT